MEACRQLVNCVSLSANSSATSCAEEAGGCVSEDFRDDFMKVFLQLRFKVSFLLEVFRKQTFLN